MVARTYRIGAAPAALSLLVSGWLVAAVPTADAAPARAPKCTIVGTAKADRLVGTKHRDVICGLGGNDVIIGNGGNDVLVGAAGADDLEGGAGKDVLIGGTGNDFLDGGSGADDIDGGSGSNACVNDGADEATRCAYDRTAPVASSLTLSTSSVDVAAADRKIQFRVRVTDDTGVDGVSIVPAGDATWYPRSWARRVTGTARNGWWEGTLTIPRWARPGSYVPRIQATDRLTRRGESTFDDAAVTVVDADPDVELPRVEILSPAPTDTFDTRNHEANLTVKVHITDDKSGVDKVHTVLSLWSPDGQWGTGGFGLRKISGTAQDGVYTESFVLPKGSVEGDWNIEAAATDLASRGASRWIRWYDAVGYARHHPSDVATGRADGLFPNGMGSIHVLGRAASTDHTPPTLSAAVVGPTSVDTLAGPATVNVSLHAADADSGVAGVLAQLVPADGSTDIHPDHNLMLTAGTANDGTWTGSITLPQGLPPGVYYLRPIVWDHEDNGIAYASQGYDPYWFTHLDTTVTVTVVDSSGH